MIKWVSLQQAWQTHYRAGCFISSLIMHQTEAQFNTEHSNLELWSYDVTQIDSMFV